MRIYQYSIAFVIACQSVWIPAFIPAAIARSGSDVLAAYPQLVLEDGSDSAHFPQKKLPDLSPITPKLSPIKNSKQQQFVDGVRMLGVQLGPLQLQESTAETKTKRVKLVETEKVQLEDLWDSALTHNPDIQFVMQRLLPAKNAKHSVASITKLLSSVMYGAVSVGSMALPQGASPSGAVSRASVQLIQNALNNNGARDQSNSPLSQTEAIMLYNVVRNVADKLSDNFHEYKKFITYRDIAAQDFSDLQSIAGNDLSPKDAIEIEYFLRKLKREIVSTEFDVNRVRQSLTDLAGAEATDKLDRQIEIEFAKLENGTEIDSQAQN